MKRRNAFLFLAMVASVVGAGLLVTARAARAQQTSAPNASYSLTWYTVDGGGGNSTGGSYSLSGTAGQPDAGALSGGAYILGGGYWGGLARPLLHLFLPLLRR